MYQLHVETDFAAAHNLRGYEGRCENLHGHNYRVEVEIEGEELDDTGLLADFKELKRICEEVLAPLDHAYLNDIGPFNRVNPTTENIAAHICREVQAAMPETLEVISVTCWESEKCAARYVPRRAGTRGR